LSKIINLRLYCSLPCDVSSPNVTWQRAVKAQVDNFTQTSDIWWCFTASQLASESVTITFDSGIDDLAWRFLDISGVSENIWSNPFDTNPSLPGAAAGGGGEMSCPNISTTTPKGLLLAFGGSSSTARLQTAKPNYMTALGEVNNGGGAL
jgi:hypothetical protein